jgi:hypothetical protein
MKRASLISLLLLPLIPAASSSALDMAALSNKVIQVAAENEQAYRQTLEANTLLALNQALCQELGRTAPAAAASSAAALRSEHQSLVADYVQDIKRRITSTSTWPAGQTPDVWKTAASRLLDQAAGLHRDALAENGQLTSSLRLMSQVRAWTLGQKALSPSESWTERIDAQAEARTEKIEAPASGGNTAPRNEPAPTPSGAPPPAPTTSDALPPAPTTPEPAKPPSTPEPPRVDEPALPSSPPPPRTQEPTSPQTATLVWVSKNGTDGKLAVRHTLSTTDKAAWIGFFKVGADDRDYLSYAFLNNLTAGVYDVARPEAPGSYEFRIYASEGYTPAAVSEPVDLR